MSEWVLAVTIVVVAIISILTRSSEHHQNFTRRLSTRKITQALIFILGLSVVGVPGLGSYFIWESLVHDLSSVAPHLVLEAFLIMTLNTIGLFVFYFTNYLGQRRKIVC